MGKSPEILAVDLTELQAVLLRLESLVTPDDYALLALLLSSFVRLTGEVRRRGTTIAFLRRLVNGFKSEKRRDVIDKDKNKDKDKAKGEADSRGATGPKAAESSGGSAETDNSEPAGSSSEDAGEDKPEKVAGHGRLPVSAYQDADHISVPHPTLTQGESCPGCGRGKVYDLRKPTQFLRIFGTPPLSATCWDCQRLRCSACGGTYTAPSPAEARGPKFDATAVSMMAILRYGTGVPMHRLEGLQGNLGTPVPSSTQWEVLAERVKPFRPVHSELVNQAAQAPVLHNDDTSVRILEFMGKRREKLLETGGLEDPKRTGLFTTAVVAVLPTGQEVTVYFSGRKHAGENLTELLTRRTEGLDPPVLMSDALSRNLPEGHEVVESNCLAHGRRKVVDEVSSFPDEVEHVLDELALVYQVEQACKKQGLTDEVRLQEHKRLSGPVMDRLREWMQAELCPQGIEPNSGLGKAFTYMLKRWEKMTLFLRRPGAPLDNNICERALKKAILQRRNSLFYRSQAGAEVADIYLTLIHTAELNGANPFDYLTELQRNANAVAENPGEWMPWNYRETMERFTKPRVELPPDDIEDGESIAVTVTATAPPGSYAPPPQAFAAPTNCAPPPPS